MNSMFIDLGLKDEKFIIDLNKLIYIEGDNFSGVRFEFRGMCANDNIYFKGISFDDDTERILRMWGNSFLYVKTTSNRSSLKYDRPIIINKDHITMVYACRSNRSITNIVLDCCVIPVDIDVATVEKLMTSELKYKDVYK